MQMSVCQRNSCCLCNLGVFYLQGGRCDLHAGATMRTQLLLLFDATDFVTDQGAAGSRQF